MFLEDVNELKVIYNREFQCYTNVAVLNNGTNINDVANLLGHRNVETTENYYITSLEDNRKNAVEQFDKNNKSNVIENAIRFQI